MSQKFRPIIKKSVLWQGEAAVLGPTGYLLGKAIHMASSISPTEKTGSA